MQSQDALTRKGWPVYSCTLPLLEFVLHVSNSRARVDVDTIVQPLNFNDRWYESTPDLEVGHGSGAGGHGRADRSIQRCRLTCPACTRTRS